MSNAERLYTLAARAYPRAYAAEHGDELIATACELTGDRVSVREALGLITGGMRTRARVATTTGRGAGVWASGLRLGLLFFSISQLAWSLAPPREWPDAGLPLWTYGIGVAMVAGLTIGTGRWYALFSTVTTVGIWTYAISTTRGPIPWWAVVPTVGVLTLVWWLALRTDGRRVISPLGGLVVTLAWWAVFIASNGFAFGNLVERTGNLVILIAVAVVGLVVLHIDPRLIAGIAAFFMLDVGTSLPNLIAILGIGSAPLLVVAALVITAASLAVRRGSRQLQRA